MPEELKKADQKSELSHAPASTEALVPEIKSISDAFQITQFALENYDDLFTDFDPSPYQTRLLSEDFLIELKRRYPETKHGELMVKFSVPRSCRSEKTEALIRKRIKDHFRVRLKQLEKKQKDKINNGVIRLAIGALISISVFVFPALDVQPLITIISVLIWYPIWSGLEHIFEAARHLRKSISFVEKFYRAEYVFMSEEEVVNIIQNIQKLQGAQEASAKS